MRRMPDAGGAQIVLPAEKITARRLPEYGERPSLRNIKV
jgi:hypothetical protein